MSAPRSATGSRCARPCARCSTNCRARPRRRCRRPSSPKPRISCAGSTTTTSPFSAIANTISPAPPSRRGRRWGSCAIRDYPIFGGLRDLSSLPPDVQDFMRRRELLVVTKSNRRATVHRTAHMDAIGAAPVRRRAARSSASGCSSGCSPRSPTAAARARSRCCGSRCAASSPAPGCRRPAMTARRCCTSSTTLPRDELFQSSEDELFDTAIGILNLQERQRIALFVRRDPLERFVSCLVYVPRERYDSDLRRRFAAILERGLRRPAFGLLHPSRRFGAGAHPVHHPHHPRRGAGGRCRGARTAVGRGRAQLVGPASRRRPRPHSARPRRRSGCAG